MSAGHLRLWGIFVAAVLLPACGVGGGGTLTPTVQPAIPAGVVASSGNRSVTVSWSGTSTGASYVVKRSLTSGGPYFPVSIPGRFPAPTSYIDAGVSNGTTYYYVVSAVNRFGESADSPEAQVTPGFKPAAILTGANSQFSMVILPDRTVWSWGINDSAQLGSGTAFAESGVPVQAVDLESVVAGATGIDHALALQSDGTVWAWGGNAFGQLGLGVGGPALATTAQAVPGFDGAVALAAGAEVSFALRNDGTVWAWGANFGGLLGNGSVGGPAALSPVPVPGLSNITAISCGGSHTLALRNDGTVWMWGLTDDGQKGDGTVSATPVSTPSQVPNLTGITAIAAGFRFNLARRTDGTVWAWGSNQFGQQGNGAVSATPVSRPAAIPVLNEIVSVAAGRTHAFAVRSNGTVWAWGQNHVGQIGNGAVSATPVTTPAALNALADISAVAAGDGHSLALRNDGTVLSWGNNVNGEVGNGTSDKVPAAVPVMNLTDVDALGSSWFHTLALRGDGTVWAWGENTSGALGNGSASAVVYPVPAPVISLTGATAVAAGLNHSLALLGNGTVRAWGSNSSGQLGTGPASAIPVTSPAATLVLAGVTAIAAGASHSLALRNDGTVWAWGSNAAGQLGTGGGTTHTPTPIPGLTGVTAVTTGNNHSLALRNDGTVWAWGSNSFGEIGIGAPSPSVPSPTQILSGITAIAGGFDYSLALASDGTVWGWGANNQGQTGIAPAAPAIPSPTPVPGLTGVAEVDAGGAHSLALRTDGTVWAWGWNEHGQLGSGGDTVSVVPQQASNLADVARVTTGYVHSLAILADKTLMAWGFNGQSQLARPFILQQPTPAILSP